VAAFDAGLLEEIQVTQRFEDRFPSEIIGEFHVAL
jgi:hypothetical protein